MFSPTVDDIVEQVCVHAPDRIPQLQAAVFADAQDVLMDKRFIDLHMATCPACLHAQPCPQLDAKKKTLSDAFDALERSLEALEKAKRGA